MNGKGLMRVLCGMLAVATVLAVASLAMVRPATATSASPPRPLGCRISQCTQCGTLGLVIVVATFTSSGFVGAGSVMFVMGYAGPGS